MTLFEFEYSDLVLESDHDFRGYDFVYYDKPVLHYNLKNISRKIQSFEELVYYSEVLLHLNPDIEKEDLVRMFSYMGSRDSKKCIRTYGKARVQKAVGDVYNYRRTPWCRRLRRVIFNPEIIISTEEKLAVVAHITKRSSKFSLDDLWKACFSINSRLEVVTVDKLSKELLCSSSTVSRLLDGKTIEMIKGLNKKTRNEKKIRVLLENIQLLTSNGDELKVRALKEMTSIRDYKLIKEAIHRFLSGY